ncbi:MAG: hypothetical protein QOF73_5022, partial [Thermomicrobiales bacterium]|nr:hypothetical protein [Thermomicrobiales bacterium]
MDETTERVETLKTDRTKIDPDNVVFSYDRESDSLVIHLYGRGIPAVSILVTDELMLRWDRAAKRAVGLQINHFLSKVVLEHPEMIDALDVAELRGINPEEIGQIRRDLAQRRRRD